MRTLTLALALCAADAAAETVVATRTIRPREVIAPADLAVTDATVPGTLADAAAAVGLEARVAIYAGRPLRPGDLGPPAIVERNGIVPLVYAAAGLFITTEGRALDRAGAGETIRVMNLASRTTVRATVGADGRARVRP